MRDEQLGAVVGAIFLIGLVVGIAVWAIRLKKRRRDAFQAFADRHGLSVVHGAFPMLHGTVDGHAFSMGVERLRGEATGRRAQGVARNIAEIVARIELNGVPNGLVVVRRGLLRKAMTSDVTTGDRTFDSKALVRCPDARAATDYLTPERRAQLVILLDKKISLEEGVLRFGPAPGKLLKLRHLEALSEPLFQAVRILDAAPRVGS
jgi:hypothetical protein